MKRATGRSPLQRDWGEGGGLFSPPWCVQLWLVANERYVGGGDADALGEDGGVAQVAGGEGDVVSARGIGVGRIGGYRGIAIAEVPMVVGSTRAEVGKVDHNGIDATRQVTEVGRGSQVLTVNGTAAY